MLKSEGSHWLVSTNGKGRRVRLPDNAPLLVGRGEHNHLVLDDYRISRQHSRVALERDGYVIYDLNSVNGTLVNGASIRRHALALGDEVQFGPFVFRFEFHEEIPSDRQVAQKKRKPGGLFRPVESITRMWSKDLVAGGLERAQATPAASPNADTMRPPGGPPSGAFRAQLPTVDLNHLEDAYQNLGTLYAFVQAISKTIDKAQLLAHIGEQILEIFRASVSVAIHLRASEGGAFVLAHFLGDADIAAPLTPEVGRAVEAAGRAIFDERALATAVRGTTLYAPLIDRGVVLGVICVAADPGLEGFSLADLELLNGMAPPATMMLQNTHMHEESLARERLRRDLELAAQIQKSFLPRETVLVEGVDFLATYRAAYTVGGDFYDVFWVARDKLAVFIGDIAGKGIAGALLMARISGELRIAALAHVEPVAVFTIMNKAILGRGQPELFFTGIYLTLDVRTGEVVLANAGHPKPYVCHANGDVTVPTPVGSNAVGMFDDPDFEATRFVLDDSDSLVLFTDGVIEATDASGTLFGTERLEAALAGVGSFPPDIATAIVGGVEQFTGNNVLTDDMTVLICHRAIHSGRSLQPRRESAPPDGPAPPDGAAS